MKMEANPENPAYSCVVNPEYKRLFNNKPGTILTLGIRLQPHLEDMEVELDAISVVRPPECPPWLLQRPNILFNLSDLRKGDTCPLIFQSMLLELFCRFPEHRKVYTDGSKEDKRTAMSFVCDDQSWGQFLFINSKFHSNSFLSILESIPIPLVLRKVNSNSIPIPKKSIPYQFHPKMRLLIQIEQLYNNLT